MKCPFKMVAMYQFSGEVILYVPFFAMKVRIGEAFLFRLVGL